MEVSDIHERLKQLLKKRHMTKYRLAMNMGVKPPTLYNNSIERRCPRSKPSSISVRLWTLP